MLFRKKVQRLCVHCRFASKVDDENMICQKCGIVPAAHHCRRFRYDPLKRVPPKPVQQSFEEFRDKDFSL